MIYFAVPPCCNVSLQQEARNATDSVIPPLNCVEIINDVGNPVVTEIIWSVTSKSDSLCVGTPSGSFNELLTFNPSHNLRNCNNANIVCRAGNEAGSTAKSFTLIFNCESKHLTCCDANKSCCSWNTYKSTARAANT